MNEASIRVVSPDEIPQLSALATEIVREHFDPIIGKAQNDYMLEMSQSVSAIEHQFESGYNYYWVLYGEIKAGFIAIFPKDGKMYLSKFYVHRDFRGKHLAGKMMDFIVRETKKAGLPAIFLNVNRNNDEVIAKYYHLGFRKLREEKNDIGNGFFMDDFVLEYTLNE